jgi:hypothetical protein
MYRLKSFHVARCMGGSQIQGYLIVLFCCLVLVYGLVASVLLVECMPGDGSCLVELIGSDPCQHPFGETQTAKAEDDSVAAAMRGCGTSQSCVDMSLDHYGVSPSPVSPHDPSVLSGAQPALAAHVGASALAVPGIALVRPAREPVKARAVDPILQIFLRI